MKNIPNNNVNEEIILGHNHSFDVGIARKLGLEAAIVYNHIIYWISINANKKDSELIEGKYWMYEKQEDIADFLGYLSYDSVKRAIKILLESGLLIKGNFNKNPFDKTSWYTIKNQKLILIKKSLAKAHPCAIDSVPVRDPQRTSAPSIYKEHNYKQEEHQHQQHARDERDADDDLIFSDKEKEELNNFTPEDIQQAIEITKRECIQKANKSQVKYFFKVIANLPKKKSLPQADPEKNKKIARKLVAKAKIPKGIIIEILSKTVEIGQSNGYKPMIEIKYTDNGFEDQIINAMRKNGIVFEWP